MFIGRKIMRQLTNNLHDLAFSCDVEILKKQALEETKELREAYDNFKKNTDTTHNESTLLLEALLGEMADNFVCVFQLQTLDILEDTLGGTLDLFNEDEVDELNEIQDKYDDFIMDIANYKVSRTMFRNTRNYYRNKWEDKK